MVSPDTRQCCGVPKNDDHANGCRYSKFDIEGNEKPLTPAQQKRARAANASADEQASETFDAPTGPKDDMPDEREEWFRAPGLRRMKMDFDPETRAIMDRMNGAIDLEILETFADAYRIMFALYDVVREHVVDEATGVILKGPDGLPQWKKDPVSGLYIEDWEALGMKQRENFLFEITTRLFDWEQRSETLWTSAMFSKAIFTEHFATAYDEPMSGTIDDRNAVGNRKAAEDRYFALMRTSVSRKAQAIVRTMTSLQLRLKDTLPS